MELSLLQISIQKVHKCLKDFQSDHLKSHLFEKTVNLIKKAQPHLDPISMKVNNLKDKPF
jgi:hypothetical protein